MSLSHTFQHNTMNQTSFNPAFEGHHPTAEAFNSALFKLFRVSTSASLGVLVTGGLIYLMCTLIAMEPPEIISEHIKIIDVVMPEQREIIEQVEPIAEKPLEPADPPDMPDIKQSFAMTEGLQITMAPTLDPVGGEIGSGFSSGSAMAIFQVAPEYPRRAISRGVEGFVDLMFDITPTGKTENIRVIYAEPEGYFEKASTKTLAKWKYKPAVDGGVALAQKNQTTRIVFELEK